MRRWRREPSRPALIAFAIVAAFVLGCGLRVVTAHRELRLAEKSFNDAKSAVAETRTDDAAASLDEAAAHLSSARSAARAFPLGLTTPIPFVGSPSKAAIDVADAGRELVAAGRVINDAAASFPTSGTVGTNGHDLSAFHTAAVASESALAKARSHIERATNEIDGPAAAFLPQVSGPARSALATIAAASKDLDGAKRGLTLLADLTAPTTHARLLLVSQDTMELRPTGGYIGSFGLLEFDAGHVQLRDFQNVHDLPPANPPLKAPEYLASHLPGGWELENSMWWPDFPTSAKSAVEVYGRQGGEPVAGVLAITDHTLARIVGALGSAQVPGYSQPVTEKGFSDRVLYEVELKRPLDNPRKKFLIDLSKVVINDLFDLKPTQLARVAKSFRSGAPGDLQVWFSDQHRQHLVSGTSVSGEMPKPDQDFLMVVDANMTAGKANRDLVRDMTYQVTRDRDLDRLVAKLRITYRNEGKPSVVNPYYNGFVRVYVPRGAELLQRPGGVQFQPLGGDGAYDTFGGYVFVKPGDEQEVELDYVLPPNVQRKGTYRLLWRRQPGTPSDSMVAVTGHHQHVGSVGDVTASAHLDGSPIRNFLHRRWVMRKIGI